jgi:hypothetical protein
MEKWIALITELASAFPEIKKINCYKKTTQVLDSVCGIQSLGLRYGNIIADLRTSMNSWKTIHKVDGL